MRRCIYFYFLKQKTAYDMRISDWSSDVCSSDLAEEALDDFGLPSERAGMPDEAVRGQGVRRARDEVEPEFDRLFGAYPPDDLIDGRCIALSELSRKIVV